MILATDPPRALADDDGFDAKVRQLVRRSREAQGLPPTVTEPAALARIADLTTRPGPAPGKGDTR